MGESNSRTVPSGNYSGMEYFKKMERAVRPRSRRDSAIFMKQCSATSSISSSSMYLLAGFLVSSSFSFDDGAFTFLCLSVDVCFLLLFDSIDL